MKNNITVKVSELFDMVQDMKSQGMNYALISIEEEDTDGEYLPPCLSFRGAETYTDPELRNFNEIEACPDLKQ